MPTERMVIGVDESGKGDFFGPLVIAAFAAPDSAKAELERQGVRDSKKISDNKVRLLAKSLRRNHPYALVVLSPAEYNKRYNEVKNLNKLLAACHAQAIHELASVHAVDIAISDKFGKIDHISGELTRLGSTTESVGIEKGERIFQVAAASIIARAEFLERMDSISEELGYQIPRGAGTLVDKAGREIVATRGENVLKEIAKLHFKNRHRVTGLKLIEENGRIMSIRPLCPNLTIFN